MSAEKKGPTTLIVIRETFWRGVASDAVSFATAVALVGMGKWIDSGTMEVVGAILFFVGILARGKSKAAGGYKTPQEAADWIMDTYDVRAK